MWHSQQIRKSSSYYIKGKKSNEDTNFFPVLQKGLFWMSRGRDIENFSYCQVPRPHFLFYSPISYQVLVVRIHNRPFLYRFSCHWPAFYQTRVGFVQLHFREVGNFYLSSLGVQTEFIKMNTCFLEESGL